MSHHKKTNHTEQTDQVQEKEQPVPSETPEENTQKETQSDKESESDVITQLTAELQDIKDKYIRLVAEFDNYKKRMAKERIETRLTAGQDILKDLLPVLDDLDRAHEMVEKATDIEALKKGFELINDKLIKNLESKGLKAMEVKGEVFDADKHEAVAEFPSADEDAKGKIFDVTLKGYVLNDRIIRYPKVVVSK